MELQKGYFFEARNYMSNRITKRNKNIFLVSVACQSNFKSVIFQSAVRLANHETIHSKLGCFVMKYNLSGYKAHCYYRAELHMIRKKGRRRANQTLKV
jgi:hypothetical protein